MKFILENYNNRTPKTELNRNTFAHFIYLLFFLSVSFLFFFSLIKTFTYRNEHYTKW